MNKFKTRKKVALAICLLLTGCSSYHDKKNNKHEVDKIYENDPRYEKITVYLHPSNSYKGRRQLDPNQYEVIKELEYEVCGLRNEGAKFRLPIGQSSSVARRKFIIETEKLGGDAVFDFNCTNTELTLKDIKKQCAGSFVCTGQAIKRKTQN